MYGSSSTSPILRFVSGPKRENCAKLPMFDLGGKAVARVSYEAGNLGMRTSLLDVFLLNVINGSSIAVLTLNDVKDIVAIALGVVSTFSTLLIIRDNFRKRRESHTKAQSHKEEKGEGFRPRIRLFAVLVGAVLFGSGCAYFGGDFLQSTPEGEKLDEELKRLLQRQQEYAGVAREVKRLLDVYVPTH